MKSCLILLLLAAHAGAALAQYKCTAANGAITFQQTPCFGAKAEEKLTVVPNGHPPAASGVKPAAPRPPAPKPPPVAVHAPGQTPDQRLLASYERQHERDRFVQELKAAQDERSQRAAQLQQDIAAAQARYGDNPVDAPALKEAIAALNSRYNALGDLDESRIRQAQADLADWDSASPPPVK